MNNFYISKFLICIYYIKYLSKQKQFTLIASNTSESEEYDFSKYTLEFDESDSKLETPKNNSLD